MNRYAILNVQRGEFLEPLGSNMSATFTDKVELTSFLIHQIKTYDVEDIDHLRVVEINIDEAVDHEIADAVDEVKHLKHPSDRTDVIDKKLNG